MIKYIFLGIAQGLTEFLPVSSSGHLVIIQKVFGIHGEAVTLSVILHMGTFIAMVIFFFKDILKLLRNPKMLFLIIIVTFITGVIGILGKDFFEELFSLPKFVALAWIITGLTLVLTRKFMNTERNKVTAKDALILGATQGIAIIPGISRAGITIATLLFRGLDKETSFRFSFLASMPAVLGAAILEAKKINFVFQSAPRNLLAGFLFSLLTGLIAIWMLHLALRKAKLYYFGYYCFLVAIITLLFVK